MNVEATNSETQYFPVWLDAGSSYEIEIISGYSGTNSKGGYDLLSNAGYTPSRNWQLSYYNSDKENTIDQSHYYYSYSYSSNQTAWTYTPSVSGVYYIGARPYITYNSSYDDGTVGFHVYNSSLRQ